MKLQEQDTTSFCIREQFKRYGRFIAFKRCKLECKSYYNVNCNDIIVI